MPLARQDAEDVDGRLYETVFHMITSFLFGIWRTVKPSLVAQRAEDRGQDPGNAGDDGSNNRCRHNITSFLLRV